MSLRRGRAGLTDLRVRYKRRVNSLQPGFMPENQAAGIASTMRLAVASNTSQVHRAFHGAHVPSLNVVAGFVGHSVHTKSFAAVLEHLRHERHGIPPAIFIQGGEDFLRRTHFNSFACLQIKFKHRIIRSHFLPISLSRIRCESALHNMARGLDSS